MMPGVHWVLVTSVHTLQACQDADVLTWLQCVITGGFTLAGLALGAWMARR